MNDIMPLLSHAFEGETKPGVSARTLYAFLGLNPATYARWVKRNILLNQYALENADWEGIQPTVEYRRETSRGGQKAEDYALSIEFAKRLAMMARSVKGEEARQYFLACEKALHEYPRVPQVKDPAIQMLIDMAVHLDTVRAEAAEAKGLATRALEGQQWLTIRQYVLVYDLARQFPVSLQADYGKWLTSYCAEHGIPVYKTASADRQWSAENTYHAGTLALTLPGWLLRRSGQPEFRLVSPDGDSTTRDPGVRYRRQKG